MMTDMIPWHIDLVVICFFQLRVAFSNPVGFVGWREASTTVNFASINLCSSHHSHFLLLVHNIPYFAFVHLCQLVWHSNAPIRPISWKSGLGISLRSRKGNKSMIESDCNIPIWFGILASQKQFIFSFWIGFQLWGYRLKTGWAT